MYKRQAWVFGLNGKNFIKTMLNVGKTHDTVRVVNDQIGTPTYTSVSYTHLDVYKRQAYGRMMPEINEKLENVKKQIKGIMMH